MRALFPHLVIGAVLAVGALTLGLVPAAMAAVGKRQAERIALRSLEPQKRPGNVAVFGLPRARALAPRAVVSEGLIPRKIMRSPRRLARLVSGQRVTQRVRRLGRRQWLFWMDRRYQALLPHPSVLLLVNARTGQVRRRNLSGPPLVNGRLPVFLRTQRAYLGARHRIYSSVDPRASAGSRGAGSALTAPAASWAGSVGSDVSAAAPVPGSAARRTGGSANFRFTPQDGECAVALVAGTQTHRTESGLRHDLAPNLRAMSGWAESVNLPFYPLLPDGAVGPVDRGADHVRQRVKNAPGGDDLVRHVDRVFSTLQPDCKDMLIYIAGNGLRLRFPAVGVGWGIDRVQDRNVPHSDLALELKVVTAEHLQQIVRRHRDRTFKFKIDANYSGRFMDPLQGEHNVLLVETSSRPGELAHGPMIGNRVGDQTVVPVTQYRTPGPTVFTAANVAGLRAFDESGAEREHMAASDPDSKLVWLLTRGNALGREHNFAEQQGLTHSMLFHRPPVTAPAEADPFAPQPGPRAAPQPAP